jgi:D-arabinose 1-dehydrogenase-like Zn-dependent alcohol dehydrogenase
MWAMSFEAVGRPLALRELPKPAPGPGQVLVRVSACGVCRTDLHVVDGELANPLALAPKVPVHTETVSFPLRQANEALDRLRSGRLTGAAVLVPGL